MPIEEILYQNEGENHLTPNYATHSRGLCVRTTKKIFLPFLRMNSNSHRNSNHPQSGYLYFFTIHYYLLPNRQVSKAKSEK